MATLSLCFAVLALGTVIIVECWSVTGALNNCATLISALKRSIPIGLATLSLPLSVAGQAEAGLIISTDQSTEPCRIDVVLFTGFSGSSGQAGLDTLSATLQSSFPNISSQVFGHTQGQAAFNFVNDNQLGRCCLVIIGHSLGGDAVIEFSNNFLNPAGIRVNLTVQIDTVGVGDEKLPGNVNCGFNYFQISTGLFEPQGAMNVMGATNINVEKLFADNSITHTSIDDDPRLHNLIINNVRDCCVPEPSTLVIFGIGTLCCLFYRRSRKTDWKGVPTETLCQAFLDRCTM
jgi:PEP-CTERM motif